MPFLLLAMVEQKAGFFYRSEKDGTDGQLKSGDSPLEDSKSWNEEGISGLPSFLQNDKLMGKLLMYSLIT